MAKEKEDEQYVIRSKTCDIDINNTLSGLNAGNLNYTSARGSIASASMAAAAWRII